MPSVNSFYYFMCKTQKRRWNKISPLGKFSALQQLDSFLNRKLKWLIDSSKLLRNNDTIRNFSTGFKVWSWHDDNANYLKSIMIMAI